MLITTEFSKEEYQTAKVDPIAQFSKPVAVYCLKIKCSIRMTYALFII
jgi:hypothetical protein